MHTMISRFLCCFFSLLILFNPASSSFAGPGKPFNKIVFFGDSLSDDGNLYAYDFSYLPKSPPYFEGRFSNQYIWSDLISKSFAEEYNVTEENYAFGGETAIFHSPASGFLPYTLTMSRNSYLIRTAYRDRSQTLFIVWIGGNDYLHDSIDIDGLSTEVVDSIKATLESLIAHGGMNFLVINLPDTGLTPLAKQFGLKKILHQFTEKHNQKLAAVVEELKNNYKSININLYDANTLFNDLNNNVAYYNKKFKTHVSNLSDACWEGGYSLKSEKPSAESIAAEIDAQIKKRSTLSPGANPVQKNFSSLGLAQYIVNSPDLLESYNVMKGAENRTLNPCEDPDSYVFFDRIHPTRAIHMMFADGISKYIKRNYDIDDSPPMLKKEIK